MNLAYVLIGPPASGKTSIARELKKYGVVEIINYTSREQRQGEQEGVDYYFVDKDTFSRIELVEKVNYSGRFYGLGKDEVLKKIAKHPVSVISVEKSGLEQLRKLLGKRVVSIFILADEDTIINRIIESGGDLSTVQARIDYAKATGEFDHWQVADYVVKNTASFETAVRQVLAIMNLVEPKMCSPE